MPLYRFNYVYKIILNSLYGIFREKKYAYRKLNFREEKSLAISRGTVYPTLAFSGSWGTGTR